MTYTIAIVSLSLLVVISGILLLFYVSRRYRRALGIKTEKKEKTEEVGFVITAFHELTKQLKEKEKELERLKALAERRAETVESYTENILQCVTNGVVTFDLNDVVTTMNRAASDILGIDRESAIGLSCRDVFKNEAICKAVADTRDMKKQVVRRETAVEVDKGSLWLGFNTALLTDKSGETIGVILSFSDLTDVKRLQEQVELGERLTALGEMSAGIAHELRNPMAVISGYLNLLSRKVDPDSRSVIGSIQAEIDGMNRIIGDLLAFARPASLNCVLVEISELLGGCVLSVLNATGQDAKIKTEFQMDRATVSIDEGLMKQAFCNIIQNAVEAMPDGGTLTIEVRLGRQLMIVIKDTGVGIPKERIKKVFLPFFTTKDKGTGLGLALAHKIILSHGGRIEVESEEGKGTVFTVILPVFGHS